MATFDDEHFQALRAAEAKVEELEAELTEGPCITRRDYIREAAMLLYVYGRPTDEGSGRRPLQPRDAWTHAKALWDAKPEDC